MSNINNNYNYITGSVAPTYEEVILPYVETLNFKTISSTLHVVRDRQARFAAIAKYLGCKFRVVKKFFVEDNARGFYPCIHAVTSNGIVLIISTNYNNQKLITGYPATPQKLEHLYSAINEEVPEELMNKALYNLGLMREVKALR